MSKTIFPSLSTGFDTGKVSLEDVNDAIQAHEDNIGNGTYDDLLAWSDESHLLVQSDYALKILQWLLSQKDVHPQDPDKDSSDDPSEGDDSQDDGDDSSDDDGDGDQQSESDDDDTPAEPGDDSDEEGDPGNPSDDGDGDDDSDDDSDDDFEDDPDDGSEGGDPSDKYGNNPDEPEEEPPTETDSEACKKVRPDPVPPQLRSFFLGPAADVLTLDDLHRLIGPQVQEYLFVVKQLPGGKLDVLHFGYSDRNAGSVSIPVDLLQSSEPQSLIVTHNHPNQSAFSEADFKAFGSYRSIKALHAVSSADLHTLTRSKSKKITSADSLIITAAMRTRVMNAANAVQKKRGFTDRQMNDWLSCEKEGVIFWNELTTAAWEATAESMSDRFAKYGVTYTRQVTDSKAFGDYGTIQPDALLTALRMKVRRKARTAAGLEDAHYPDESQGMPGVDVEALEPIENIRTTNDVMAMAPPASLPIQGEIKAFLGNLLTQFRMLVWGPAGSGKSSWLLKFADALARTDSGKVLYLMTEERIASGRLQQRIRLMRAFSSNVSFDDSASFNRFVQLLNSGDYRHVIIDSVNAFKVDQTEFLKLMEAFPEINFVLVMQTDKSRREYRGLAEMDHSVDTVIKCSNQDGIATAETVKHRDGSLGTMQIFASGSHHADGSYRQPSFKPTWK